MLFDDLLYGCTVRAFVPAFDNGYMLAGETAGEGLIVKIDSQGNYEWAKKYSATSHFNDIKSTADSAFVIIGVSNNDESICMKLSILGDTIWQTKISGSTSLSPLSFEPTFDGGTIICGYKEENSAPYTKVFVAKLDSNGNLEWSKYYVAGNDANFGHSIHQVSDSGYIVSGFMENLLFDPGTFIMKLNSAGEIIWSKELYDNVYQFACNADFIITNDGLVFYSDYAPFFLIKTDLDGNIIWSKNIENLGGNLSLYDSPNRIHSTHDGGYCLVDGSCFGSAVIKIDSMGNLIFAKYVDLIAVDSRETADHGIIIVGNGPMCGLKTDDYLIPQIGVIKTDSLGFSPLCVYDNLNYPPVDYLLSETVIDVDSSSDAVGSSFATDVVSISMFDNEGCVAQAGDISQQNNEQSISIYPNPAENIVHIESKSEIEFLRLTNFSGKLLLIRFANASDFDLDLSQYSQGIYLLTMKQTDQLIHKMIVKQ